MVITILNIIAFSLVFIGSVNWGLVGIFNFNLVSAIFGAVPSAGSVIVYVLVLLSALWLLFVIFWQRFKIIFCMKQAEILEDRHYQVKTNNSNK